MKNKPAFLHSTKTQIWQTIIVQLIAMYYWNITLSTYVST